MDVTVRDRVSVAAILKSTWLPSATFFSNRLDCATIVNNSLTYLIQQFLENVRGPVRGRCSQCSVSRNLLAMSAQRCRRLVRHERANTRRSAVRASWPSFRSNRTPVAALAVSRVRSLEQHPLRRDPPGRTRQPRKLGHTAQSANAVSLSVRRSSSLSDMHRVYRSGWLFRVVRPVVFGAPRAASSNASSSATIRRTHGS